MQTQIQAEDCKAVILQKKAFMHLILSPDKKSFITGLSTFLILTPFWNDFHEVQFLIVIVQLCLNYFFSKSIAQSIFVDFQVH